MFITNRRYYSIPRMVESFSHWTRLEDMIVIEQAQTRLQLGIPRKPLSLSRVWHWLPRESWRATWYPPNINPYFLGNSLDR